MKRRRRRRISPWRRVERDRRLGGGRCTARRRGRGAPSRGLGGRGRRLASCQRCFQFRYKRVSMSHVACIYQYLLLTLFQQTRLTVLDQDLGDLKEDSPSTHHPMKQQRALRRRRRAPRRDAVFQIDHFADSVFLSQDEAYMQQSILFRDVLTLAPAACWAWSERQGQSGPPGKKPGRKCTGPPCGAPCPKNLPKSLASRPVSSSISGGQACLTRA